MIDIIASLDTFTLQTVAAVIMLLTLGASLTLWHSSSVPSPESYTRFWAGGYFLICLGLTIGAMRGYLPTSLAIVTGNVTTALGGCLIVNGTRQFCQPGQKLWPAAGIGLTVFILFCLLTYAWPNLRIRIILMAGLFALVCLDMARQLWIHAPPGIRMLQRTLAALLSLQFVYYLFCISTVLIPASATEYSDAPAAYNAVYLDAIVLFIVLLFGFTGLTNRRLQMQLQHVAHHDALTGALNRHALDLVVNRRMSGAPTGSVLSVVVFDLDHFKQLNDTFGHQAGDAALRRFVEAASANLRQGDELGRTGGEEFCLILPDTDGDTACRIAERLRKLVETLEVPTQPDIRLTVSAGVATTTCSQNWTETLKKADDALYCAKRNGRNRVVAATIQGVQPVTADTETLVPAPVSAR